MIEVPGVDMATVAGQEERKKSLEKDHAQPLLEEDFDQVIAKGEEGETNKESQGQEPDHVQKVFPTSLRIIGILVFAGAVLFLSGLMFGLLLARIWGPMAH